MSVTSITVSDLLCYVSHWTVQDYFNTLKNKHMSSMPGIKIKSFYSNYIRQSILHLITY